MPEETTRLVKCTCKKCGETFKIDIGNLTREGVEAWLAKDTGGFQCPGMHVELGRRSDYWMLDWDSLSEDSKLSDEDWLRQLMSDKGVVWTTDELTAYFDVKSFAMGYCIAKDKTTGDDVCLSYAHAPQSGKRYYYR